MSNLNGRIAKLEKKSEPAQKIVVVWPGEAIPEGTDLENTVIIRVVYADDWRRDEQ